MGSPRQDAVGTGADDDIVPDAARLDARPDEPHHTGVCELSCSLQCFSPFCLFIDTEMEYPW